MLYDYLYGPCPRKVAYKATWGKKCEIQWREAGPPDHLNDKVDLDQSVGKTKLSL
jgi:hypothetical protein